MRLRKVASLLLLAWAFGFVWFAVALPQPHDGVKTDAVVVLTGGRGRIDRGLEILSQGLAPRMLVSGVDREVKQHEFALQYGVPSERMACCVTLGYDSYDTQSNAGEVARWMRRDGIGSIRLVTSDWHMRRAAFELRQVAPAGAKIVEDAVPTQPSLRVLFLEYHKLLARHVSRLWGS